MRPRFVIAGFLVLPAVACGLSVTGIDPVSGVDDGGVIVLPDGNVLRPDGEIPDDAARPGPDAAPIDSSSPADAAPDVVDSGPAATCLAVCAAAGGTCIGNVCTIASISTSKVKCPTGVPCHVICGVSNACSEGVDCANASTCRVDCTASNACQNGVTCNNGTSCDVSCTASAACRDGVTCKASDHCGLTCSGASACMNGGAKCQTAGDCSIVCGGSGGATGSCADAADCAAGKSCDITCSGADCAKNNRVHAKAPDVHVVCNDGPTCKGGVKVEGGKAVVDCGTGGACEQHIQCTATQCSMSCQTSSRNACCSSDVTTCNVTSGCNKFDGSLSSCN